MDTGWALLKDYRYVEAYPRFEIGQAVRGFPSDRRHVVWRDEHGECVGFGNVDRLLKFSMEVSIELFDTRHLHPFCDKLSLTIQRKKAGDLRTEPYVICDGCQAPKRYLVYKQDAWMCMRCQELFNRSSMVSQRVRFSETIVNLELKIGGSRPIGMHQTSYDKLCNQRDELEDFLQGRRYTANTSHSVLVGAEWLPSIKATGLHSAADL